MQTKNSEKKIEVKEFLSELRLAMKDYFEAKVTEENDGVKMTFSNGQAFVLSVKEN